MRHTLTTLRQQLDAGRKIAMLTCYDAGFAKVMEEAGVDSLLVGDSLGMVVQGNDSTLPVTLDDICYHVRCLARSTSRAWIIADMPFGSYQESPAVALRNAVRIMQAGAHMVKLEGGAELVETVDLLVRCGIPVCGHVGLLPQRVHAIGGYRVQGRKEEDAERIVADARALEQAGAAMLVIEGVPEPVARRVCEETTLITIGIGASAACDGQVLVMHDMLGLTTSPARFVKDFTAGLQSGAGAGGVIFQAFRRYVEEVSAGTFPGPEHVYSGATRSDRAAYGAGTTVEPRNEPPAA